MHLIDGLQDRQLEVDIAQDRRHVVDMLLHLHDLGFGQASRLGQDLARHRELADLGQVGRDLHGRDLLRAGLEALGDRDREAGEPARMAGQVGIAQLDRTDQRRHHLLHRPLALVLLLDQFGHVAGHGDDAGDLAALVLVGHLGNLQVMQAGAEVDLLVDRHRLALVERAPVR